MIILLMRGLLMDKPLEGRRCRAMKIVICSILAEIVRTMASRDRQSDDQVMTGFCVVGAYVVEPVP